MRGQQSVRAGRGEPGEIRFPEPGSGLGPEPGAKGRTVSGHDIGVQIVENQAAAGRTQRGEIGQSRIKRFPGEVSGDAKPNDQARPGGVESAVEKLRSVSCSKSQGTQTIGLGIALAGAAP